MTHIAPLALDTALVRETAARTLSQVMVEYRSSPLSHTAHAAGTLRSGDRLPDIEVTSDGTVSVPLYSLLDPSRITVLVAGGAPLTQLERASGLPLKVVPVRQAQDTRSGDQFRHSFGDGGLLCAVRPDAYAGFVGRGDDAAGLGKWLRQHFSGSATTAQA
jgi:hypothetical protein